MAARPITGPPGDEPKTALAGQARQRPWWRLLGGAWFGAALLITLIAALSGGFAFNLRGGDLLSLSLDAGTLRVRIVADHRHGAECDCLWQEIYYPNPPPQSGVLRRSTYHLAWALPGIHRTFVSVVGEWWTITLPLWCLVALGLAAAWFARRRARVQTGRAGPLAGASGVGDGVAPRRMGWLAWASGVAVFIVVLIWVLSGWWYANVRGKLWYADISAGVLSITIVHEDLADWIGTEGVTVWPYPEPFRLEWTVPHTADWSQSTVGHWWEFNLPLWAVLLVVSGPLLRTVYQRWRHRMPPGTCTKCGYDLTGNVSGRCPECGAPIRASVLS